MTDHEIIASWVKPGSTALDLGCGSGELLFLLERTKGVRGIGIERNEDRIYPCVEKGLSVIHGDIETELASFDNGAFDYVILNQTLQEIFRLSEILEESLRVGGKVIIGFPNFTHITSRYHMLIRGRAPVTRALPNTWYDTPNIHFFGIRDFKEYCRGRGYWILEQAGLASNRRVGLLMNLLAATGLFLITKVNRV